MDFLGIQHGKPKVILCDNKAACQLSDSDHTTKRMKHVAIRLAYLQELVDSGAIALLHIGTQGNLADLGTKPLPPRVYHGFCDLLWS